MKSLLTIKNEILQNGRILSVLSLSMFYGWLMSLPFEGKVFYAIAERQCTHSEIYDLLQLALLFQFIGLLLCGLFIKNSKTAKKVTFIFTAFCILGSFVFFIPYSLLWHISIAIVSMCGGFIVGGWGVWLQSEVSQIKRVYMVADVLIYSNIFVILSNVVAVNLSPNLGFAFCIIFLLISMMFTFHLPEETFEEDLSKEKTTVKPTKLIYTLYLFMAIITINSGLMFTVICGAFKDIDQIASWYWPLPYVLTLIIVKKLPRKTNRYALLTVAIAMSGVSFILFAILNHSLESYIIINTLMLGSLGIFDLFGWSTLGKILDYVENPAKIFGIGLSANILGIMFGRFIAERIIGIGNYNFVTTIIAAFVVFTSIGILPMLYKQLTVVFEEHTESLKLEKSIGVLLTESQDEFLSLHEITDREKEIIVKVLQGKTYKSISEELFLSINTVKFHVKNIYSKLEVHNRSALINILEQKK